MEITLRSTLFLVAASLALTTALLPVVAASGAIPPLACTNATSRCAGVVCALPSSADSVCVETAIGVCIENHPPCEWDQLACVYDAAGSIACVPDIS